MIILNIQSDILIALLVFFQEAEAFSLYNRGLDLLRHGKTNEAEETFRDLIDHDFLVEVHHFIVFPTQFSTFISNNESNLNLYIQSSKHIMMYS